MITFDFVARSLIVSFAVPVFAGLALAAPPGRTGVDPALSAYQPHPADVPTNTGYLDANGAVQIVGNGEMEGIISRLNELFIRTHPGFKFSYAAADDLASSFALIFDRSAFAPMGSDYPPALYARILGATPIGIRIAHASLNPSAHVSPLGFIVNQSNPIDTLTSDQVTHLFTVGGRKADIIRWSQLGLKGELGASRIDCYGLPWSIHDPSEDASFASFMVSRMLGGGAPALNYEPLRTYDEVIKKVRDNPAAVGIVALNRLNSGIKLVGIRESAGSRAFHGTAEDIASGDYPYDRYLYLYVRRLPGRPLNALQMEYLRLALSQEGQQAIANEEHGYIPLDAFDAGLQLKQLSKLAADAEIAGQGSPKQSAAEIDPARAPADGSVFIGVNDLMTPILDKFNEVFTHAHPNIKIHMLSIAGRGGLCGVVAGSCAVGAEARDPNSDEIAAFVSRYGYAPTGIQIGWDNNPGVATFPSGKSPPGIWVNAKNPVPSLTLRDLAAIFTTGSGKGDITHWGQLSVPAGPIGINNGDWATHAIHVYLPNTYAGRDIPALYTSQERMGGLHWTPRAEYLPAGEDVINAVANDVFSIGLIGWWPTDMGWDRQVELGDKIKYLPLAASDDDRPSHGGMDDPVPPLSEAEFLWVNQAPGKPLEPWLKDYLEFALSKEGQDIIASLTKSEGCKPLDASELLREQAKLR